MPQVFGAEGNPSFATVINVARALGVKLHATAIEALHSNATVRVASMSRSRLPRCKFQHAHTCESSGKAHCCVVRNALRSMIQSFRHKGLRRFFESGIVAGIQPHHANRLRMQLAALDTAQAIADMGIPGFHLHLLKGAEHGRWSIRVNRNWRLTFEFRAGHSYIVDYEDYH